MPPKISIITPTYNRAHLLGVAYQSLLRQDSKDFEWIIIDDGGADNTQDIVRSWIEEGKINIIYERQQNGGVNRARNRGIELAQGELCLFLDDDDYLSDDAVSTVYRHGQTIRDNPRIAGLLFLSGYQKTGKVIGQPFRSDVSINNYIRLYFWDKIDGDRLAVHKTEIQKKYPFPAFAGEKFAPEGIMFARMAKEHDYLCVNSILLFKEYLEDGITINRYSESETIIGELSWHYERMDKAFPFSIRNKSVRRWLRLKLQTKASLFSIFRESNCFWLCLANLPGALANMLLMWCRKKLGVVKSKRKK
jgi:glycosyltransferase involved in cell wall biosynthesis